ncbi:MAG: hypothetical protein KDM91_03825 [Verrucomicrobiae bacterium]|nr:hypothetical protein [Verrucomicrobiae bacterium]
MDGQEKNEHRSRLRGLNVDADLRAEVNPFDFRWRSGMAIQTQKERIGAVAVTPLFSIILRPFEGVPVLHSFSLVIRVLFRNSFRSKKP